MESVLSIIYILGAMLIGLGAFMIHLGNLGKSVGAGFLAFGIILIGIAPVII